MPKAKRPTQIATRLDSEDLNRFLEICQVEGMSQTDLARKAIRELLERQAGGIQSEIRDNLAKEVEQLKDIVKAMLIQQRKTESHIASLLVRCNIDIGIVYQLLWYRSDPKERKQLFEEAKALSVKRLKVNLTPEEQELKGKTANEIGS